MPITFEQPDPMGYSALAGVPGQVAQGNLDRSYLMQMTELGLQAGRSTGGGGASAANEGNANRATQAALANQQQSPSMAEQYHYGQQGALQAQQQQGQQALLAQHAQQDMQTFSFADNLRLQRVQAGKTQLKSMLDAGEIDQPSYDEGLSNLMGVEGPLTLKQKNAQAAAMQDQQQAVHQQATLEAAHTKTLGQFLTDNPTGVRKLDDNSMMYFDGKSLKHVAAPKEEADPTLGSQGKPAKDALDMHKITDSASKIAQTKDPVSGDVGWNQDLYDKSVAAQVKTHQQIADQEEIRHHESSLASLKAVAPGGDLNKLSGKRLEAAQTSLAQLARLRPPAPVPTKTTETPPAAGTPQAQVQQQEQAQGIETVEYHDKDGQLRTIKGKRGENFNVDEQGNVSIPRPMTGIEGITRPAQNLGKAVKKAWAPFNAFMSQRLDLIPG